MKIPSGIEIPNPNPSGFCFCGCGKKAPIATQSDFRKGIIKGYPMRFIHNHHMHQRVRYVVEDRGYKTTCWIWQLAINEDGYGETSENGVQKSAHRLYYERRFGPISKGLVLDHLCRVRCCVNPDHLEPVTSLENTRRGLNCKLSPEDIPAIKKLHEDNLSLKKIADMFGVTKQTIFWIVKGKNWKGL
jgi:hypothetical protein